MPVLQALYDSQGGFLRAFCAALSKREGHGITGVELLVKWTAHCTAMGPWYHLDGGQLCLWLQRICPLVQVLRCKTSRASPNMDFSGQPPWPMLADSQPGSPRPA